MKSLSITIFFILYSFKIKPTFQSHITYPFKKSKKEEKYYPENLLQNDIEITLKIGTPPQSIDLNLRSKAYTFFVSSSEIKLRYQTFNEFNSTTLIKETEYPDSYGLQEYNKGYKIYESIIINEKEIKNISLILATSIVYRESGALGLRLVNSHEIGDDLSFIYQIKKPANLDNYAFTLRYEDDEKGELIIGTYPHLYDKIYSESNFYYTKAGIIGKNEDWVLDFDLIKYDNKTVDSIITKSLIKIEFGLLQAPFKLKKYFNDNFFNNKCKEKFYYKKNITLIHCDKDFNITKFKNLSFVLKDIDYEFILTYKELFIEQNNEFIFSIVFDENIDNKDTTWILGKIFMKKYQLTFDLDRKIICLYKENTYNEYYKKKSGILFYIILLIILLFVILGLITYIVYITTKQRRKKAFELNDDFDYVPSDL